jgi:hypothetical protein
VQIREVSNGVPTRTVLAEAVVPAASLVVTGGGHTRIRFDAPVALAASTEYALVILCNDADTAVAIAEMGQFDSLHQQWVAAQPYTIGVLLSSSNASTWTAHQTRDLTFRLLEAGYAEGTNTLDLGTATVTDGATDLILLALAESPHGAKREDTAGLPSGKAERWRRNRRAPSESCPARCRQGELAATRRFPVVVARLAGSCRTCRRSAATIPQHSGHGAKKAVLLYSASIPSGAS